MNPIIALVIALLMAAPALAVPGYSVSLQAGILFDAAAGDPDRYELKIRDDAGGYYVLHTETATRVPWACVPGRTYRIEAVSIKGSEARGSLLSDPIRCHGHGCDFDGSGVCTTSDTNAYRADLKDGYVPPQSAP